MERQASQIVARAMLVTEDIEDNPALSALTSTPFQTNIDIYLSSFPRRAKASINGVI